MEDLEECRGSNKIADDETIFSETTNFIMFYLVLLPVCVNT
jgi:hypothetical protein